MEEGRKTTATPVALAAALAAAAARPAASLRGHIYQLAVGQRTRAGGPFLHMDTPGKKCTLTLRLCRRSES